MSTSIVWQDWPLLKLHKRFQKLGVPFKRNGNTQIKAHPRMVRDRGEGKESICQARIEVVLGVAPAAPQTQLHMALQSRNQLAAL